MTIKHIGLACAAAWALAGPADAVMIAKHYDFTINYDRGAFPRIRGSFDAAYDSAGGAVAVRNFSSNLPAAYALTSGSAYGNVLTLGTDCDVHGCSVTSGRNEFSFVFVIDRNGDAIYPYSFVYARAGDYTLFDGDRTSFSMERPAAAAVPEPASWALLIAGFGSAGAALRRRKVKMRYA